MALIEIDPVECGGCGRIYDQDRFHDCPFCYVEEFLREEADSDYCPICGAVPPGMEELPKSQPEA